MSMRTTTQIIKNPKTIPPIARAIKSPCQFKNEPLPLLPPVILPLTTTAITRAIAPPIIHHIVFVFLSISFLPAEAGSYFKFMVNFYGLSITS